MVAGDLCNGFPGPILDEYVMLICLSLWGMLCGKVIKKTCFWIATRTMLYGQWERALLMGQQLLTQFLVWQLRTAGPLWFFGDCLLFWSWVQLYNDNSKHFMYGLCCYSFQPMYVCLLYIYMWHVCGYTNLYMRAYRSLILWLAWTMVTLCMNSTYNYTWETGWWCPLQYKKWLSVKRERRLFCGGANNRI